MGYIWMIYFVLTLLVLGAVYAYPLIVPSAFLGKWFPFCRKFSANCVFWGTRMLLNIQPWYKLNIRGASLDEIRNSHAKLLFISNHRSHLDVFVYLTQIRSVCVLANQYLFKIPFFGLFMKLTGQIPVLKGRPDQYLAALNIAAKRIHSGESILIFPEMTRCQKGFKGVLNFSTAPFRAALDVGATIVPLALRETDQVWGRDSAKINAGRVIELNVLPVVQASHFKSADELTRHVRAVIELAVRQ